MITVILMIKEMIKKLKIEKKLITLLTTTNLWGNKNNNNNRNYKIINHSQAQALSS